MTRRTYLVGGAVRDRLLGLPERERDWLVTGTDADGMLRLGYRQVGREFPVFLHPETAEEYALPRAAGGVEEDLRRRDLTINAMALDGEGNLVDPCNGRRDLEHRVLRHTAHFRDDPIRLLRLARFAARYHDLGFRPADETRALLAGMVRAGELDALVPERVFAEISAALRAPHPRVFFEVLRACGALAVVLPEIDRLYGVPQPEKYHPEIDSGLHCMLVLDQACMLSEAPAVRFAALLHDLGKGTTPPASWPRHIGHEERGVPLIRALAQRLKIPKAWCDLAVTVARYHLHCHRAFELRAATLLRVLEAVGVLRRPGRLDDFLAACTADARGRTGHEHDAYPQADYLRGAAARLGAMDNRALLADTVPGEDVAAVLRRARLRELEGFKRGWG